MSAEYNLEMKSLIWSLIFLLFILMVLIFLPASFHDFWHSMSLKKIFSLILAMVFIQLLGTLVNKKLGTKKGSILTGFLGGIVSSTAVVTEVARSSKISPHHLTSQIIVLLSSTMAMFVVAMIILLIGTDHIQYSLFWILLTPLLVTIVLIAWEMRSDGHIQDELPPHNFEILQILKLTFFLLLAIFISRLPQPYFQEKGMAIVTFFISLFEMHGSIVANLQLHDTGALEIHQLGGLLAISVLASYGSKLFLVFMLGSRPLQLRVFKYTCVTLVSLALGWVFFSIA